MAGERHGRGMLCMNPPLMCVLCKVELSKVFAVYRALCQSVR